MTEPTVIILKDASGRQWGPAFSTVPDAKAWAGNARNLGSPDLIPTRIPVIPALRGLT
jgi:hypothetical protein